MELHPFPGDSQQIVSQMLIRLLCMHFEREILVFLYTPFLKQSVPFDVLFNSSYFKEDAYVEMNGIWSWWWAPWIRCRELLWQAGAQIIVAGKLLAVPFTLHCKGFTEKHLLMGEHECHGRTFRMPNCIDVWSGAIQLHKKQHMPGQSASRRALYSLFPDTIIVACKHLRDRS